MPSYKDINNKLHHLDSAEFEHLLPYGCVAITDAEAESIRKASLPAVSASDIWKKIKDERDRRINSGGYKVGAKWFHSDLLSRSQQLGMVILGASIPANLQWKTMDGSFIAMTQELAGQVFAAATASDIAIFTAAEAHKAAMEANADPAAYDYLTGWPLVYGE
jgi:hypothetical protein